MARLRNSVLASYAGQAWIAIIGIAFIPAYLRALGAEAFGLVAFMFGLQALSLVLDLGVSAYLSREIARRVHDPDRVGSVRRMVRTFEWLAWPTAAILLIVLSLGSGAIASHWLTPSQLDSATTANALQLVALAVALLWPTSLYNACLTGLEEQPRMNLLLAIFATLRYVGVLPVIHLTNTGVLGFLAWHALLGGLQTLSSAWLVWHRLPPSELSARFALPELLSARRFAMGIFAITGLAIVFTQLDRFAISMLRPLEELGWYAVALSISAGLARMVQPVFNAVYPRLSGLASAGLWVRMSETYHLSSQLVVAVAASVAAVVCLHGRAVLWLWTGDAELADRLALPLALLVAGTALSGIQCIPYALQLANGWVRLAAWGNLVLLLVALPLYYFAVRQYGMVGAAASWLAINLGYAVVTLPVMHRRLLPGELGSWLFRGAIPPAIAAIMTNLAVLCVGYQPDRDLGGALWLACVSGLTLAAALAAAPAIRAQAVGRFRRRQPDGD